MGRPRLYENVQEKWRTNKRRQRRKAAAPDVVCREIGPHCTVYQGYWQAVYALLPRQAAVVSAPPYRTPYDWTKTRRRQSQWRRNFKGADEDFNPLLWLMFPEVILFGANTYKDLLPQGGQTGSWWAWDKMPGQSSADFKRYEHIWLSIPGL